MLLVSYLRNLCIIKGHKDFFPCSFRSLGFTYRSMIHIEFILHMVQNELKFIFFAYEYIIFPVSLVEITTFLQWISLVTL